MDRLIGALIGLAKACGNDPTTENTTKIIIEGLYLSISAQDKESVEDMIQKVHDEKNKVSPGCASCMSRCGNTDDYDMRLVWDRNDEIAQLKSHLLLGIQSMSIYAKNNDELDMDDFFYKALTYIGCDMNKEYMTEIINELSIMSYKCLKRRK